MPREQAMPADAVRTTFRVRYAETDQMRVAHHARYLEWFELARAEFCRARGVDYNQMEADGYFLPVVEAQCRYLTPAKYDDEITVAVWVTGRTSRAVRFGYVVLRDEQRLATGATYQMLTGPDGRARAFPEKIARSFDAQNA